MSFATSIKGFKEILSFNNPIELIFHHLFRSAEKLCIYRFGEYQVVILKSGGDLNGLRACIATDQYKQFFKHMDLEQSLKILDLGAHTGGFIFALLDEGHVISKSLSVEQNEHTYSRLTFNIALNHLSNSCAAIHAAVWSKSIKLISSEGDGRTSGNVNAALDQDEHSSRMIQGYSLNELFKLVDESEVVDICKIDVEGAEWEIFSHLQNCDLLFKRCRYLIIEIHPSKIQKIDLLSVIQDNNFELLAKCIVRIAK